MVIAALCSLSSVADGNLFSLPEQLMQLSLPLEAPASRTYQFFSNSSVPKNQLTGELVQELVQAPSPHYKSVLLARDLGICILNKHSKKSSLFSGPHFEEC